MAIARPIRVLAIVAVVLWVFFLYQIFGPTRYPKGPGDRVTLKNMDRDPNLDREFPVHSLENCLLTA
jgi:mannosyltransferase